jgi:hypothetical protein
MVSVLQKHHNTVSIAQKICFSHTKRGFPRCEKGLMTGQKGGFHDTAAIAMHIRSNCNARAQQLLWDDLQAVFV